MAFNSPSDAIQVLLIVENPAGYTHTIFLYLDKWEPLTLLFGRWEYIIYIYKYKCQVGIEMRLPFLQMTQEEASANVGTSEMGGKVGKGLNALEHNKASMWDY